MKKYASKILKPEQYSNVRKKLISPLCHMMKPKKENFWVRLHREQSHLRNTVWRVEQVILSMTKDAGSKFSPHDSCSYFHASEYLLRREFIFVDKCILQKGNHLKSIFGKQTYWRKNKTDCILYFSKELDFLFIREMFSFASAATICRHEEFFRYMLHFKHCKIFTQNAKFRTHC